jgi:hypothetical protein
MIVLHSSVIVRGFAMNEQRAADSPHINWQLAWSWGIASFLVNFVLTISVVFLLGEHDMSGGEIFGFSVFAGIINGVTCGYMFDGPRMHLEPRHWLAVVTIAGAIGYGIMLLFGSELLGVSISYATAFTLVGLPMGYVALQVWLCRPVVPKDHPDNIP